MRPKLDIDKLQNLQTANDMLTEKYGMEGSVQREDFDAKARAWYFQQS